MIEHYFFSNLTMPNWRVALQWYLEHLNTSSLMQKMQQGNPFTNDDWHTFLVLNINIFILFLLVRLLINIHQQSAFQGWIQEKRSQLVHKFKRSSQTNLEAKVQNSTYLKQAYNLHRFAMYDHALKKYKHAFQTCPYDLNTYLVGIKIISEMDEPNQKFIHFLQMSIKKLHAKHPKIWQEVAKYGQEKTPQLMPWEAAS